MSTKTVDRDMLDSWATDANSDVALRLKQSLLPVEESGIIFPPTYADIGYNIDVLADGTKVALIDSVGSQANRIEPVFKRQPYAALVPQIEIELYSEKDDDGEYVEKLSLLDLAHRGADAVVYSCPKLAEQVSRAFRDLKRRGDAGGLCRLAPTSLLFGVWDSRGGSGQKRPRLMRSLIRAWNVEPLFAAAQFNSVWKKLSSEMQAELKKEAKAKKVKLSGKGLADAPATFRKVSQKALQSGMSEFRNGSPNPERRILGGVIANGEISREITVNLVALRALFGRTQEESESIRRYLLGLALLASTADVDMYLREGCHLRFGGSDIWQQVPRRGEPSEVDLTSNDAQKTLMEYASNAARSFEEKWPKDLTYKFDMKEAKKLLSGEDEDNAGDE